MAVVIDYRREAWILMKPSPIVTIICALFCSIRDTLSRRFQSNQAREEYDLNRFRALVARCLSLAVLVSCAMPYPAAALDAFPGAAGYGKATQGGRGGRIIYVTNLNDAGPGSFRACVEATGRRVCIFRVGGIIRLQNPIGIRSLNGGLSVLGQTAPGGGILLTIGPYTASAIKTALFVKNTSDVLIRHLRVRLQYPNTVGNADALTVESSSRVYVDHFSGSWATDENFNTQATATDLTVAYSIFAEGLQGHSKCALLGSDPSGPQRISFWRNVCISNNDRNPDSNHYGGSCIEIINNVFYNARTQWAEIFSQQPGGTPVSYVANYFKAGPNTSNLTYAIDRDATASVANPEIYHSGNVTWAPNGKSIVLIAVDTEAFLAVTPTCPLSAPVLSAATDAYQEVSSRAGAFPRDSVDRRMISELGALGLMGTGSIRSAPASLPNITGSTPYSDLDFDGMADSGEAAVGAVVGVYDPWADADSDGWPNLDEFMQWLSEERIAGRYPQ